MTARRPSPLVGYNTTVRHRGVEYHVQTEDSGVEHPHVITHLFVDGGRIVATHKTSYAEHVDAPTYPEVVRQLIRTQHAAMIAALGEGAYDDPQRPPATPRLVVAAPPPAPSPVRRPPPAPPPAPKVRRTGRASPPASERTRDSLDDIIIADLVAHLDD